jgi:hypothetical protein
MKPVYEEWLTIADPQSVKLLYASVV